MHEKRVTLHDVARASGFSIGTVDRALHNRKGIRDDVKKKVLDTIAELGYRPDPVGRSLSKRSARLIGLVHPKNPSFFWSQVRRGCEAACEVLAGYGTGVTFREIESLYGGHEEDYLRAIDSLLEEGVELLILVALSSVSIVRRVGELRKDGVEVVTLNVDLDDPEKRLFFVGPRERQTGAVAAGLLGKLLHRNGGILLIHRSSESPLFQSIRERLDGFQTAIERDYPHVRIEKQYSFDRVFDDCDGENVAALLDSQPPIEGIYDTSAASLGLLGELMQRVNGNRRITLIGHEMDIGVPSLLANDTVAAVICQQPYQQGYHVVQSAHRYLFAGELPEGGVIHTKTDIIIKENCDAFHTSPDTDR